MPEINPISQNNTLSYEMKIYFTCLILPIIYFKSLILVFSYISYKIRNNKIIWYLLLYEMLQE